MSFPSKPITKERIWLLLLPLAILATLLSWLHFRKPLQVTSTTPPHQATQVALLPSISVTFSQKLDPQNLPQITFQPEVRGQTSVSEDHTTLIFTPNYPLTESTTYQVTLTGPKNLKYSFSFTTKPPPQPRPAPRLSPQLQRLKDQLISQLPTRQPGFSISYNPQLDLFHINIHNQPPNYIRQQALKFFQNYGFSDPVNQLKLFFNVPRVLDPPLPGFPTPTLPPSPSPISPLTNPFIGP